MNLEDSKGTVDVISSNLPLIEWHAKFTQIPFVNVACAFMQHKQSNKFNIFQDKRTTIYIQDYYLYSWRYRCKSMNEGLLQTKEKEGAIGFPYTLLWRFWTAEELVSAYSNNNKGSRSNVNKHELVNGHSSFSIFNQKQGFPSPPPLFKYSRCASDCV